MNSLGDRNSCHGQTVQSGEVTELLLWRVNGVRSLLPVEHVRFCRQPVEILTDQLPGGVAQLQLQEISRRQPVRIRKIEGLGAAIRPRFNIASRAAFSLASML